MLTPISSSAGIDPRSCPTTQILEGKSSLLASNTAPIEQPVATGLSNRSVTPPVGYLGDSEYSTGSDSDSDNSIDVDVIFNQLHNLKKELDKPEIKNVFKKFLLTIETILNLTSDDEEDLTAEQLQKLKIIADAYEAWLKIEEITRPFPKYDPEFAKNLSLVLSKIDSYPRSFPQILTDLESDRSQSPSKPGSPGLGEKERRNGMLVKETIQNWKDFFDRQ